MQKYQVVFFGAADIAIPALSELLKSAEISVKAVVTQPDWRAGRHQELLPPPVKKYAQTINIKTLQPEKLRGNGEFLDTMREMKPDLFVVEAYGKILPKELLDIPTHGAINIHISLLPKYRGASPVQQALLNGDSETGITIMKISEKIDEGAMLLQKKIPIYEQDNLETLTKKLAMLGGEHIERAALDYLQGKIHETAQDSAKASYCTKIAKEDGKIDWKNCTAQEIKNRIRAFTPWPSCYTMWGGKLLKILEAKTEKGRLSAGSIQIENDSIKIGTKENLLIPTQVQLEGKKPTDIRTFLNGNREHLIALPKFE